jgi:hypothetical protein
MGRDGGFDVFLSYARSDEAAAAERGDRQQRERRLRQSGEDVLSAAGRRMTPAFGMMRAFEDVAGAEKTSGRKHCLMALGVAYRIAFERHASPLCENAVPAAV